MEFYGREYVGLTRLYEISVRADSPSIEKEYGNVNEKSKPGAIHLSRP